MRAEMGYEKISREVPVRGHYDVIVAGGGPSGCSAAISAARYGAKVLLLEKDGYLGGATVSQSVCVILSTNGVDFQGIWHEFMEVMKRRGGVYEDEFRSSPAHYHGVVDPEIVKYAWDELLTESGVDILHHALVIDALVEHDAIHGVVVATKEGNIALHARRVIDCTGDGLVCEYAGVPWEQGAGGEKYAMATTKVIRLGNVHKPEGFPTEEHINQIEEGWKQAVESEEYDTPIITTGRVKGGMPKAGPGPCPVTAMSCFWLPAACLRSIPSTPGI